MISGTAHKGEERKKKLVTSQELNSRLTLYSRVSVAEPLIPAATILSSSPYVLVTGWLPCYSRNTHAIETMCKVRSHCLLYACALESGGSHQMYSVEVTEVDVSDVIMELV